MNQAKPIKISPLKSPETPMKIPFSNQLTSAGFGCPAEEDFAPSIDLNEELINHPAATFFVRVAGTSMEDAHIYDGDILIIDRAIEHVEGKIILARLGGEFTVKRFKKTRGIPTLYPENPKYAPIVLGEESDFEVWGVVTYVIHKAK